MFWRLMKKINFWLSWLSGLLSAEIFISTGEWGVQMPPLTSENSYFLRSGGYPGNDLRSWNWSWSWNLRSWSWSWSWSWYSGDLPELELELELKPPELELILWRLAGVGVGVETSGVGVGVGVDIMELTPTLLYRTWRYYSKFDSTKSLGVCYRCVKISQWGYIEHG